MKIVILIVKITPRVSVQMATTNTTFAERGMQTARSWKNGDGTKCQYIRWFFNLCWINGRCEKCLPMLSRGMLLMLFWGTGGGGGGGVGTVGGGGGAASQNPTPRGPQNGCTGQWVLWAPAILF